MENHSTTKKNKSLSLKLSFSQVRQQISSYIKVDLLIFVSFILIMVVLSETSAEKAYKTYYSSPESLLAISDYIRVEESNVAEGLRFFKFVEKQGLVREGSYRKRSVEPAKTDLAQAFLAKSTYTAYDIYLPNSNGSFLKVTVFWELPILCFTTLITILLVYQIISLPFLILRSRNRIRKALEPLYRLTATAQTISNADISGTIDALNTITGSHLDRRISISDEREELQGLAQAINNMLDRLDASYRAQLRFVSDASHELRTPIAIIQGYAQLLNRWGKDDPKTLQESIDAIQSETESMQILVEQLLFLARSDNRSLKMSETTVSLSKLMVDVAEETRMVNETHKIVDHINPNIFIFADPQLIKQAVRILVDNAVKYTPENGQITISLEQKNNMVYMSVTDTGIGISPENLQNLFTRFWRADSSRTRKTGGTGLGLSIAKWIAESHNGYIEVVSREDIGSKFSLCIPLSPKAGNIGNTDLSEDDLCQENTSVISTKEIK